jgi:hypothetical protein
MDIQRDLEVNPVGPLHGDKRAIRGGSYTESLDQCTVATRKGARPDVHQMNIGFRCVLPIPAEAPMANANERTTIQIREETRESQAEPVVE